MSSIPFITGQRSLWVSSDHCLSPGMVSSQLGNSPGIVGADGRRTALNRSIAAEFFGCFAPIAVHGDAVAWRGHDSCAVWMRALMSCSLSVFCGWDCRFMSSVVDVWMVGSPYFWKKDDGSLRGIRPLDVRSFLSSDAGHLLLEIFEGFLVMVSSSH